MVVQSLFVTVNPAPEAKKGPQDKKAYDGRELKPGEILVPMMAFEDRIKLMEAKRENIRTWHTAGRAYSVMFYPVEASAKDIAMKQFYSELREYLGTTGDAKCLIPQEDGSTKICPRKSGDNRCACVDCPHNGVYERQDKVIESLDALIDEFEYEPSPAHSAEEEVMFAEIFKDLMDELRKKYPREEQIVTMLLDDMDKDEIFKKLGVKQSQGYNLLAKTVELVTKIIYS